MNKEQIDKEFDEKFPPEKITNDDDLPITSLGTRARVKSYLHSKVEEAKREERERMIKLSEELETTDIRDILKTITKE